VQKSEKRKKNKERDFKLNTIVYEENEQGESPVDVYQKLSDSRILFVTGIIDDDLAADIAATLLLKDQEDSDKKITLFINSQGGDIRNVFMIYDMIQMISAPVETVCIGEALSEAAVLLAAGAPGSRLATRNAIISFGQLEQTWNAHADMVNAKKWLDLFTEDNRRMMKIIADACHKPLKQVMLDFDRVVFMNSSKAAKYGLIDKVITIKNEVSHDKNA
jgi:ATP-dependent Clp protease, protease subunit